MAIWRPQQTLVAFHVVSGGARRHQFRAPGARRQQDRVAATIYLHTPAANRQAGVAGVQRAAMTAAASRGGPVSGKLQAARTLAQQCTASVQTHVIALRRHDITPWLTLFYVHHSCWSDQGAVWMGTDLCRWAEGGMDRAGLCVCSGSGLS